MKTMLAAAIALLTVSAVVAQAPSDRTKPPETVPASAADLMTPAQFQALSRKPADSRFSYGTDANQFGELRVPSGIGPHPVAILTHGGCWKAEYGSLRDLAPMADTLKAKGIATWNIEYRRLGQAGSGWPGTYRDIGRGVDYLRSIAVQNHLDLTRVIVVGHSAGGHLAMWVAARSRLPKSSLIYVSDPLPIRGVIDLAGIVDYRGVHSARTACLPRGGSRTDAWRESGRGSRTLRLGICNQDVAPWRTTNTHLGSKRSICSHFDSREVYANSRTCR